MCHVMTGIRPAIALRDRFAQRPRTTTLIAVVGVVVTIVAYAALRRGEARIIRGEFRQRSYERIQSIQSEFESGVGVVHAVSAHLSTHPEFSRTTFRLFVRRLLAENPEIRAVGWNVYVKPGELNEHVRSNRVDDANYVVTEMNSAGVVTTVDRDHQEDRERVVVTYLEPIASNEKAIGLDIASEPIRREAIHRARDTGKIASSGRIKLVQGTGDQYGTLVMAPLYSDNAEMRTVQDRRDNFQGVAVGVHEIGTTVEAALQDFERIGVDVHLYDESSATRELLYAHYSEPADDPNLQSDDLSPTNYPSVLSESTTFDMAGRRWMICCTPTAQYLAGNRTWLPTIVLVGGLILTMGLVGYLQHLSILSDELRQNIADRERAEESLRIAQHAIDSSHIPVFWLGPDSGFKYVNSAAATSLGYTIEGLQELGVSDIDLLWPASEWEDRWEQLKHAGSTIFESSHQRQDGESFPVEIMANYFSYADQEFMFCMAMDISDRKAQQEQIREQEQVLTHVTRLSTLGEMVAGIAHEINQPLSAISNFAHACSAGIAQENYHLPLESWTRQIAEQAVDCGEIIRRLRKFVKRNVAKSEPINLNATISDSILLVANDARNRSVRICRDSEVPNLCVCGNRVELQQVIVNLLKNAFESVYDSKGQDNRVLVWSGKSADSAQLFIEDYGSGIDPKHESRIFETFFTTKADGLGMGLAISRSIVEAHGGRLWHEPAGRNGVRFHVDLPLHEGGLS